MAQELRREMTPERWQQIKAVYEAVDSAAPADRGGLLKRLCGDDSALRQAVEDLLAEGDGLGFMRDAIGQQAASLQKARAESSSAPSLTGMSGRTIGPFRLLRLVGRGGMGEVYAAEDPRLGRQLALKLLPAFDAADSGRVRRFQLEARAASALNHPNIVTIYDLGSAEGIYYIATELVQGQTLRQVIERGPLPVLEVIGIAVQLASALVAAHEAGIVHRDIKPENIMVRPDGYVKVLDFGLAKLRESAASGETATTNLTRTGVVIGTARYMSPEQARGLPLDNRTDLFSAGVVIYELIAGHCPFRGKSGADIVAAILEHEPEPLAVAVRDVPKEMESIVRKCLRKDCSERYQTSQDLLADLRQVKQQLDPSSASLLALGARPRRRLSPARLGLAALALAALATGTYFWQRDPGYFQSPRITQIVGSGPVGYGILSPDGRYIAYTERVLHDRTAVKVRLITANSAVEVVPPARVSYWSISFSADGAYLYCVSQAPDAPRSTLFRIPILGGQPQKLLEGAAGVASSPDGAKFAFTTRSPNGSKLSIANADGSGSQEIYRSSAEYAIQSAAWLDGHSEMAVSEASRRADGLDCKLYSVRPGGQPRELIDAGQLFISGLNALPERHGFLAVAKYPGGIYQIYFISGNGKIRQVTHDLNDYQVLSVSRDGKRALATESVRRSQIWTVTAGNPKSARSVSEPDRRFDQPVWLPDGRIVAARAWDGQIQLWTMNADGAGQQPLLANDTLMSLGPSVCPDRDVLVFTSKKGPNLTIRAANLDGSNVRQVTSGPDDQFPECLAGGVVEFSSRVGRERVEKRVSLDGGEPTASTPAPGGDWSPDGRYVEADNVDKKTHQLIATIKTKDGVKVATFPITPWPRAWSPDSRGFAYVGTSSGIRDIWYQSTSGGAPRQLTNFESDLSVYSLIWSRESTQIVCARGSIVTDMLLLEDSR